MSSYSDYFDEIRDKADDEFEIDFGVPKRHKNMKEARNYRYTHPNVLVGMTTSHSKKVSHSKQDDLLGAIEMLTYKPPEILPISEYTKQLHYGSGKPKPFIISETENLSKPPMEAHPTGKKPIEPVKPVIPPVKPMKPKPKPKTMTSDDKMLDNLVKQGLATIPVRNDKVPDRVLKEEAQRKKDQALMDKVNKPLVSRPKPVIRMGFKGDNKPPIVSTI